MTANWRLIVSDPSDGPGNMAIDDALFEAVVAAPVSPPVLRIYRWTGPCITFGYFQKIDDVSRSGLTATRRLTGGLAVTHGSDVSYAFIASDRYWDAVYRQEETYRKTHAAFQRGLEGLGIASRFAEESEAKGSPAASICVQRLYRYDLLSAGLKILGSSQRRRGKVLLQQGSLHLRSLLDTFTESAPALAAGFEKELGISMGVSRLTAEEMQAAKQLLARYRSAEWNSKF